LNDTVDVATAHDALERAVVIASGGREQHIEIDHACRHGERRRLCRQLGL